MRTLRNNTHAHQSCDFMLKAKLTTWTRSLSALEKFSNIFVVNSGFPSTRINLSPFTKDFRGGEQLNESID